MAAVLNVVRETKRLYDKAPEKPAFSIATLFAKIGELINEFFKRENR